jgi:thioredoxin-related protein
MAKQVFTDKSLQSAFEKSIEMYETYRSIVGKKIDCSDPRAIVEHLSEITSVMYLGITAKAQFQYLTEKLSFSKLITLNNDDRSATEKKMLIAYEIGDCSFYNNITELLIKECHYKIEILRSALSYSKSELNLI